MGRISCIVNIQFDVFPSPAVPPPQRPQTWSWALRLWSRPRTWRTGPCTLCSVPRRSAACPALRTKQTPAPTAASCASPPRSTTTGCQTSDRGRHLTPGSGMNVTGGASTQPGTPAFLQRSNCEAQTWLETATRLVDLVNKVVGWWLNTLSLCDPDITTVWRFSPTMTCWV